MSHAHRETCPTCGHALWPTDGITPRQRDAMIAIQGYTEQHGCAPSYDDIRCLIGLASKGSVHRIVNGLADRGYLSLWPARPRSIEILRRVPVPDAPRKRRAAG